MRYRIILLIIFLSLDCQLLSQYIHEFETGIVATDLRNFENGFGCISTTEGYRLIDTVGNLVKDIVCKFPFEIDKNNYIACEETRESNYDFTYYNSDIILRDNFDKHVKFPAYKNDNIVFRNIHGKDDFQTEYDLIKPISDELFIVTQDQKSGIINRFNNVILDISYEDLRISGTSIIGKIDSKFGIIKLDGTWIIEPKYSELEIPSNYLGKVADVIIYSLDSLYGVMDFDESRLIPDVYDKINYDLDGRWIVEKNGLKGCFDLKGNIIVPIEYNKLKFTSPEWYSYQKYNYYIGIKKLNGEVVLSHVERFPYPARNEFKNENEFIVLTKKDKLKSGKSESVFFKKVGRLNLTKVPFYVEKVENEICIVRKHKKYMLYDYRKKKTISKKYSLLKYLGNKLFAASKSGNSAIINSNGKLLTKFKYCCFSEFNGSHLMGISNNQCHILKIIKKK